MPSPLPRADDLALSGRLLRVLVGLALCGVGIALMVEADLGLGPWDVLHQGVATRTPLTIGRASIVVGALVLAAWLPLRERPGIGTILNIVVIGLVVDATLAVLPEPSALGTRAALLIASTPVFAVGTGLYIGAGLGAGPRDGLMTGLARRGVPVGVARTGIEATALLGGWALGGRLGIGTLYFAASIGPLVHVALPRLRPRTRSSGRPAGTPAPDAHGAR